MVNRPLLKNRIINSLKEYPVTVLLGPRQCGKTTIAKEAAKQSHFFDLEDPSTPLVEDRAKIILEPLQGIVVIDEIQKIPSLFNLLRVLADRKPVKARFLVLGSASPHIVKNSTQTLAGRANFIDMGGFNLQEVEKEKLNELWLRGGFPLSFLASSNAKSMLWRNNFIRTFLERDIPMLGIRIPTLKIQRFWTMTAHYHGNIWNAAEFGKSLGTKEDTARRYLDILTGAYMVFQLPPWFENIGKRLVKSPKIYIQDTGILHALLRIESESDILSHFKLGYSWEGFAISQIIQLLQEQRNAYFYKAHSGAELDLFITKGNDRFGFEFKFTDAPRTTKSMSSVLKDLRLNHLWVVYPGTEEYPLKEKITALPLKKIYNLKYKMR